MLTNLNPYCISYTIAAVAGILYQFVQLLKPSVFIGHQVQPFYTRYYIPAMACVIPFAPFYAKALSLLLSLTVGDYISEDNSSGVFFGVFTTAIVAMVWWLIVFLDDPYGIHAHVRNLECYRIRIIKMWILMPLVALGCSALGILICAHLTPWMTVPLYVLGVGGLWWSI